MLVNFIYITFFSMKTSFLRIFRPYEVELKSENLLCQVNISSQKLEKLQNHVQRCNSHKKNHVRYYNYKRSMNKIKECCRKLGYSKHILFSLIKFQNTDFIRKILLVLSL